jgi:NAD(P)-dependent dehydrogenase (short-subunit alcohol dehydrogenase family)
MPEYTALVTGCSSGIGRATAAAFRDEEWTVFATARDPADIDDLAERGCETLALDVTDPEECKAAVETTVAATGRLDCLVNNAGFAQFGAVEDVPPRRLHRQFDVNLYGPHRLLRWALPHMREAERGTVVNVSSMLGRLSVPGTGPYAASKAALESLSDALRAEVSEYGVDVVLVEPGPVETRFRERAGDEVNGFDRTGAYEYIYEAVEDRETLGDLGTVPPAEVADTILHAATCADPDPRYAVGEVGRLLTMARWLPDRVRDRLFGVARRVLR